MTFDEHHMHLMKKNVVDELFTRTADENYITARWCAMNGLQTDFFLARCSRPREIYEGSFAC
jgi:hypothetical protein